MASTSVHTGIAAVSMASYSLERLRGCSGCAAILSIARYELTGDDDRSEALPDERVDDLDHRAAWAVGGQGVGSPRRVSHHVAGRSHVGGIDSSTWHQWSKRLADLVSIAGVPDESRTQSVRVAAAIGPLRSLERSRDLSHQARHCEGVVAPVDETPAAREKPLSAQSSTLQFLNWREVASSTPAKLVTKARNAV